MPDDSTTTVTLPRYRCGIVVSTAADPRANMDEIMETMAGRWGWAGGELRLLSQVREPVIIHWLGDMFDPALAGYWGHVDPMAAMDVAVGRRILPKAELIEDAAACLRLLSGRNHRVYTAVCLVTPKEAFRQRLIETRVRFKRLSEEAKILYVAETHGGQPARPTAAYFLEACENVRRNRVLYVGT